jgi:hypothetical protein
MFHDEYGNELPFKSIDYRDLDNAPIERCQEHVFHDAEGLTQYTAEYKRRYKYGL